MFRKMRRIFLWLSNVPTRFVLADGMKTGTKPLSFCVFYASEQYNTASKDWKLSNYATFLCGRRSDSYRISASVKAVRTLRSEFLCCCFF